MEPPPSLSSPARLTSLILGGALYSYKLTQCFPTCIQHREPQIKTALGVPRSGDPHFGIISWGAWGSPKDYSVVEEFPPRLVQGRGGGAGSLIPLEIPRPQFWPLKGCGLMLMPIFKHFFRSKFLWQYLQLTFSQVRF